jgi:hypothetical protein
MKLGPTLGLLLLDTRFPRPPGDVGNPETFSFPIISKVVHGASAALVTQQRGGASLDAFKAAGRELVARGARGLLTSCGFLTLWQDEIAAACGVPVAASALLQVAPLQRCLPVGRRVGVVTFDARHLSADHLVAAGAPEDTPVEGVEGGELHRVVLGDAPTMDRDAVEREIIAAAGRLMARGDIGGIVLECANMGPYASAVARQTKVPILDVVSLGEWLAASLKE